MNIYYVTSPFQYMCAEEAKNEYKTENDILILEESNSLNAQNILESVVDKSNWKEIIIQKQNGRTFSILALLKKLENINKSLNFSKLFYSQYTSWFTNIIKANINFEKQIHFDDGTLTIYDYEKYIKNKKGFSRSRFYQDFLLRLQGVKPPNNVPYFENFELFTIFNIENPTCTVRENKLTLLKNKLPKGIYYDEDSPIGIIGQGAIGHKNQFPIDYYKQVISDIATQYKSVIYFPHRTESNAVRAQIKQIPNLVYHQPELPLELEIAFKNLKLSKMYGIASTVFFTFSILYPEIKANLINVDHTILPTDRHEKFLLVVESAKNMGIN